MIVSFRHAAEKYQVSKLPKLEATIKSLLRVFKNYMESKLYQLHQGHRDLNVQNPFEILRLIDYLAEEFISYNKGPIRLNSAKLSNILAAYILPASLSKHIK